MPKTVRVAERTLVVPDILQRLVPAHSDAIDLELADQGKEAKKTMPAPKPAQVPAVNPSWD
ncbi:hypothetical protein HYR54_15260 [Candidatus Acetothermia bacterium]|nr:hypothetical protein [Candidatus Acetothermia bacterium]